jgi:hypothetical protein
LGGGLALAGRSISIVAYVDRRRSYYHDLNLQALIAMVHHHQIPSLPFQ